MESVKCTHLTKKLCLALWSCSCWRGRCLVQLSLCSFPLGRYFPTLLTFLLLNLLLKGLEIPDGKFYEWQKPWRSRRKPPERTNFGHYWCHSGCRGTPEASGCRSQDCGENLEADGQSRKFITVRPLLLRPECGFSRFPQSVNYSSIALATVLGFALTTFSYFHSASRSWIQIPHVTFCLTFQGSEFFISQDMQSFHHWLLFWVYGPHAVWKYLSWLAWDSVALR